MRTSIFTLLGLAIASPALGAPMDVDGDGRSDLVFHIPGSNATTVGVLRAAASSWSATNALVPVWANQPGVVGVVGDYNRDGRADVAFHRPGGGWSSVPVLFSVGGGTFTSSNFVTPAWANEAGAIAIGGDFNGDGRGDLAFHKPGGTWASVPVLLGNGNGSWTTQNAATPTWPHQAGVIAIPGDFNGDGRTDLAFHRPGSWSSTPVLLANGSGGWTSANFVTPAWANEAGVVAIAGDYNGDGRTDLAFHQPTGGTWTGVHVLLAGTNGSWTATTATAPSWANQLGVVAVAGDFNNDRRSDLAFHKPGGTWETVPVLLRTSSGTWSAYNTSAPSWANQPGVIALPGDYNADGRTDIAFHRPDGVWGSIPVLYASSFAGVWASNNFAAAHGNALGTVAVRPTRNRLTWIPSVTDEGDPAYDQTAAQRDAWDDAMEGWMNFLRLFVRIVLGYQQFLIDNGLNGDYDGTISGNGTSTTAFVRIGHNAGQIRGLLVVRDSTLRLAGGVCPDLTMPTAALDIVGASIGQFQASGWTTRTISMPGILPSTTVDVSFQMTLEQTTYSVLTGTIDIDVPWPCANQSFTFRFVRRPL